MLSPLPAQFDSPPGWLAWSNDSRSYTGSGYRAPPPPRSGSPPAGSLGSKRYLRYPPTASPALVLLELTYPYLRRRRVILRCTPPDRRGAVLYGSLAPGST